jgi:hypothetical protein
MQRFSCPCRTPKARSNRAVAERKLGRHAVHEIHPRANGRAIGNFNVVAPLSSLPLNHDAYSDASCLISRSGAGLRVCFEIALTNSSLVTAGLSIQSDMVRCLSLSSRLMRLGFRVALWLTPDLPGRQQVAEASVDGHRGLGAVAPRWSWQGD